MRHRDRTANARDVGGRLRVLSVPDLILAQAIIVVGLIIATMLHHSGWYGVAAAAVGAALLVTPARGQSVLGWVRARYRFLSHRRQRARGAVPACATAFDAPQPDG